ncbi:MAG: DUF1109 domain-containing protein [Gemmobacter sp.]|uniref:NrsF family protein n=1 Tax=Gemmobacter sp. TaxID=1898957 RepID=UPI001A47FAE7|nr:NrsF family protein [Gemmobacter sp.]MBL8563967.1 DUF1109 domain-containing protein [Gemmobacter sp.]
MKTPMKTNDLIASLTHRAEAAPAPEAAPILLRSLAAGLPALVLLLLALGLRADLAAAITAPQLWHKFLLPPAIAATAALAALRLMRPEARLGALAPLLLALLAAGTLPGLWRLAHLPSEAMAPAVMGKTAPQCLVFLVGLAAIPIVTALSGLRAGASTRPGLSGGLAGLACAATAASGYALHCPEDDPVFFAIWYMGALVLCTLAGLMLGRRRLAW